MLPSSFSQRFEARAGNRVKRKRKSFPTSKFLNPLNEIFAPSVDYKVCSVNETWSGLAFARKRD